ncbi:hypothetical protein [uncultured Psychroserpens sp.]|uniref:hypothetical protein n=1 Tax=uncultured Psychroserpens sp. TaxID=255436 RepID=UPI00263512BD|nr:hypothetical protein [uncultured Psychroserpens sp.]
MRILRTIFDFYINSSIHVALAVYALSWLTLIQFNIAYDENVLYFIFFASITGYNFVKYFGLAKFHHRSLANWLRVIQVFSLICFVVFCYYLFKLSLAALRCVIIFGMCTFLYAIPVIPKNVFLDKHKKLRSISGLKIYIIAMVWAGVTVVLPLVNNDYDIYSNDVVVTVIQRFLLVIILMLPFEIRDLSYDSLRLATIPQRIGIGRTKVVGVILSVVLFLLEYFKHNVSSKALISLLVVVLITILFLLFARTEQRKYYSSFWVESIPLYWLALLLMLS